MSTPGSFAVAEHYLCALLAHGLMYAKTEIIDRVNEVREQYQVLPFKKPEHQVARDEYGRSRMESVELKVRKAYGQMTEERRHEVMTPEDWPEALRIGEHTAKNFSRQLAAEDRMEAYYDMESNPQEKLCDKLWEIIIQAVLTEIP